MSNRVVTQWIVQKKSVEECQIVQLDSDVLKTRAVKSNGLLFVPPCVTNE